MRNRWPPLFLLSCFVLTAALAGALHLAAGPSAAAEEGEQARLMLKCDADQVGAVRRALSGLDVEIYDLETMKRLPALARPGSIPALPDAEAVMVELMGAVASVTAKDGSPLLQLTDMAIQPRRATVKIETADRMAFDAAAKAIGASALLKARGAKVERGSLQSLPGDRYRTSISMRFAPDTGTGGTRPPFVSISMQELSQAEMAARMRMIYASPLQKDPNRSVGYATISREFTYDPTTLRQLQQLIAKLSASPSGLTVYELRWKLAPAKERAGGDADAIQKPVVRVGGRLPLAD